jgi:hypothetical protein
MAAIFHQEDGQTVKITPGRFCPACHDPAYLDVDEGFRECRNCGRCYSLPSQRQIDVASQKAALETATPLTSTSQVASGE